MILASFHSFGSLPSRSEQLKIADRGGASRAAWSFKTQARVLSGPDRPVQNDDDPDILNNSNFFSKLILWVPDDSKKML